MNTPAHTIFSLFFFDKRGEKRTIPILIGALLPDIPMFLFYLVEKVIFQREEMVIWKNSYDIPAWQNFFDLFNSIPIITVLLLVGIFRNFGFAVNMWM